MSNELKCPKCDEGYAGTDCTGEALDCHYCDGNGNITAEAHVELQDRFYALVGDAMADAEILRQLQASSDQRDRIIKTALQLKEKYRTKIAEKDAEIERLQGYEYAYIRALDYVDEVFQTDSTKAPPLLPDFCRLGENKFAAVKRLAKEYLSLKEAKHKETK